MNLESLPPKNNSDKELNKPNKIFKKAVVVMGGLLTLVPSEKVSAQVNKNPSSSKHVDTIEVVRNNIDSLQTTKHHTTEMTYAEFGSKLIIHQFNDSVKNPTINIDSTKSHIENKRIQIYIFRSETMGGDKISPLKKHLPELTSSLDNNGVNIESFEFINTAAVAFRHFNVVINGTNHETHPAPPVMMLYCPDISIMERIQDEFPELYYNKKGGYLTFGVEDWEDFDIKLSKIINGLK